LASVISYQNVEFALTSRAANGILGMQMNQDLTDYSP